MNKNNVPQLHIDTDSEWSAIELKPQIERRKSSIVISEVEDELNFNQLTKDDLEDYFELIDIQDQLMSINRDVKMRPKKGFYNLISLILPCKIPKIKSSLLLERDRIFATAHTQFDEVSDIFMAYQLIATNLMSHQRRQIRKNANECERTKNEHMHFRLLITIYEILMQERGYFSNKIQKIQESIRMQSYMFASSSHVELPTGRKSFRRLKHARPFKARSSFGNQSMTKNELQVNDPITQNDDSQSNRLHQIPKSMPDNYLNASPYESRRNKSFDLSSLNPSNQMLNGISTSNALSSRYKYRLNDEDVSDQQISSVDEQERREEGPRQANSLNLPANSINLPDTDSVQTSLNSNLDYLSAFGLSNYHLDALNQYSSTGHLAISGLNRTFSRNRHRSSRHSLRSATDHSWSGSRKSSAASYTTSYNERVSATIFHRSIRYGDHWQKIGFQGNDPVTDLRDLGLLSLFQLCFFLLNYEKIALRIFKLSTDAEQNFPFALMGVNISQISLQTLRQGHLNRILNSRNEVLNTFNLFYSSLFLKFYQLWTGGKMTIQNSNDVLKELRLLAATKSRQLLDKFCDFESTQEHEHQQAELDKDEKLLEFTDISKIVITDL